MRERSANFVIRIKAAVLHKLLESVAERAYRLGFSDAQQPRAEPDVAKLRIDPLKLRKFL
jgi:hypothetical protein